MHFATGLLRFCSRDYFVDLLLGGSTAQESQHSAHFSNVDELVAMMIEHTKGIRNAFLQVVIH